MPFCIYIYWDITLYLPAVIPCWSRSRACLSAAVFTEISHYIYLQCNLVEVGVEHVFLQLSATVGLVNSIVLLLQLQQTLFLLLQTETDPLSLVSLLGDQCLVTSPVLLILWEDRWYIFQVANLLTSPQNGHPISCVASKFLKDAAVILN